MSIRPEDFEDLPEHDIDLADEIEVPPVRHYLSALSAKERERFVDRLAVLTDHIRRLVVQVQSVGLTPVLEPEARDVPPEIDRQGYERRIRDAENRTRQASIDLETSEQERVALRLELMRMKQKGAGELISAKAAVRRGQRAPIIPRKPKQA